MPINEISDWTFFIEFDLCGEKIIAGRNIKNAGIVKLNSNFSSFPIKPERDKNDDLYFFNLLDWRKLLGICLFGIPSTSRTRYIPTFRNLISYFIRTGIDAYSRPFTYLRNQNAWQSQVANAFLLGLNWEHASAVQELKDKDKAVKSLNNAVKALTLNVPVFVPSEIIPPDITVGENEGSNLFFVGTLFSGIMISLLY